MKIKNDDRIYIVDENTTIKYGQYLTVNYKTSEIILWTDYENTEPYNRNSGLYGFGSSFNALENAVAEFDNYREFNKVFERNSILSFRFDEYSFNDFYKTIEFDISIKSELVEEFILELRKILNK